MVAPESIKVIKAKPWILTSSIPKVARWKLTGSLARTTRSPALLPRGLFPVSRSVAWPSVFRPAILYWSWPKRIVVSTPTVGCISFGILRGTRIRCTCRAFPLHDFKPTATRNLQPLRLLHQPRHKPGHARTTTWSYDSENAVTYTFMNLFTPYPTLSSTTRSISKGESAIGSTRVELERSTEPIPSFF